MPQKTKLPLGKRILLWLTKPIRLYIQFRFKVAIEKDIRIYEELLRKRKPHWNEKQIQKRARRKFVGELKKVGLV